MKLVFVFANSVELANSIYDSRKINFEIPDAALQIPDCRERILKLCNQIGQLTDAAFLISNKDLQLRLHPVKSTSNLGHVNNSFYNLVLRFRRLKVKMFKYEYQLLKIAAPSESPFYYWTHRSRGEKRKSLTNSLYSPHGLNLERPEQINYMNTISALAASCVELLNSDQMATESDSTPIREWSFEGFHPHWFDDRARIAENKKISRSIKEQKQKEKLTKQFLNLQNNQIPSLIPEGTKRVGAIPGIFKGVQFRSQLEIRFATQLEELGIKWVYEPERLGEGNYLVDFYLPDLKSWVEVKGRFEPRDNFLLKDVARYLKKERGEKLYVYSSSKAFCVNSRSFQLLSHQRLWEELSRG